MQETYGSKIQGGTSCADADLFHMNPPPLIPEAC